MRCGWPRPAIAAALLLAVILLPACGGGGPGGGSTLLVGVLADFSGVAAPAVQPAVKALEDYLTAVVPASSSPLPGSLKVEFTHFDTELDYAMVIPGYVELLDRGVDVMVVMNPQDRELLGDMPEADNMPTICPAGVQSRLNDEWMLAVWSPVQSQAQAMMEFIMDDWDYSGQGRSPKVGHLGSMLFSSEYYQEGIEAAMEANPGRFTPGGLERAMLGNETWDSHIVGLLGSDYIITSVPGAMLSSFVAQARSGGYAGKLVSGVEGFPGFWSQVATAVTSRDHLQGCYCVGWWPWWNEAAPLVRDCRSYVAASYPAGDAAGLLRSSSVIAGWEMGLALEQAIRNAAAAAGAEEPDGQALKDGMRAVDVQIEGCLERWRVTPGNNCLQWSQRAFQYSVAGDAWEPLQKVYRPAPPQWTFAASTASLPDRWPRVLTTAGRDEISLVSRP